MKFTTLFTAVFWSCACLTAPQSDEMTDKIVSPPPLMVSPIPQPNKGPLIPTNRSPSAIFESSSAVAARIPAKRNRTWVVSFGPGLSFYNGPDARETNSGSGGFASHFGGVTQLTSDSPFFVGADIGLQFWGFDSKTADRNATGIQLTPTAYYNFDWNFESTLQPYLGVSAGPHVYISRSSERDPITTVNFELLLRPGLTFLMAPGLALNFEPKIGILGGDMIFLPQMAANLFL